MTQPNVSTAHQKHLLRELSLLVHERAQFELQIGNSHEARTLAAETQYRADLKRIVDHYESTSRQLEVGHQQSLETLHRKAERETHRLAVEQAETVEAIQVELQQGIKKSQEDCLIQTQRAEAEYESRRKRHEIELADCEQLCEERWREFGQVQQQIDRLVRWWRIELAEEQLPPARWKTDRAAPMARFDDALASASEHIKTIKKPPAAWVISIPALVFVFLMACFLALLGVYQLEPEEANAPLFLGAGTLLALIATVGFRFLMIPMVKTQIVSRMPLFFQEKANAREALDEVLQQSRTETNAKLGQLESQHQEWIAKEHANRDRLQAELTTASETRAQAAENEFREKHAKLQESVEQTEAGIQGKFPAATQELEKHYEAEKLSLEEKRQTRLRSSEQVFESRWENLTETWNGGFRRFIDDIDEMNQFCRGLFPEWNTVNWKNWQPPTEAAPVMQFGAFEFSLETVEGGVPRDSRLLAEPRKFFLPAVLSYPECPSLLFKTEGDGRDAAAKVMQNVMLRLLTSMPPGKVRFTIVDPVGLGQNFSAFMHLADYDEKLVNNRIWTEADHITQRLTDLTEHMENVIQKYLRNEFASIQEYNASAGEVAEPFQILVVANFPANFSEDATRRLLSIAASGARCGVYTLMSVDTQMKLPRNLDLADLEKHAATMVWSAGEFGYLDEELSRFPLHLDEPPSDEQCTQAICAAGEFAKDASRVEVPFQTVAPAENTWWQNDSRGGIDIPLGRAGATKLQRMQLGKGTSQHVLVAGKTGSGKSSMMHALITNLAMHYSPDEIQFYLIDFKKGVEFKAYATYDLPHARVIAIESEREFGLSVLQRLDYELKRRGDLFREQGVQDVRGYRDANPEAVMPRIMLIVDEFQELFVADDKLASDAALLLDRLVRQGRAFGIHVLLGSQTLSGAYSLARSTLGQMAVRIALQCSETDAHMILSEDNTAARLLGRPGEAIYNDANGLLEGNHPFQVVWLPDHEREHYLQEVAKLREERQVEVEPAIVFEGNIPANPEKNKLLRDAIEQGNAGAHGEPRVWLGAAVAIKEPTFTAMARQSGSNLLVVGQHEPLVLGTFANAVVSLAATQPANRTPRFVVLDGTRSESPDAGFWDRLAKTLPLDIEVVPPRDAAAAIQQLSQELQRRTDSGDEAADPIYLITYHLSRFRDLRKSDDYSFSFSDDDSANAAGQLTQLLREGPNVGMHALIWCDTYTNAARTLDRTTLRELEARVLLQMSAADSSNLMDSPAASRLGVNRAILYSEERGEAEKFRPYGRPTDEWLRIVQEGFARRQSSASETSS